MSYGAYLMRIIDGVGSVWNLISWYMYSWACSGSGITQIRYCTHKKHPISLLHRQAMGCLLWKSSRIILVVAMLTSALCIVLFCKILIPLRNKRSFSNYYKSAKIQYKITLVLLSDTSPRLHKCFSKWRVSNYPFMNENEILLKCISVFLSV